MLFPKKGDVAFLIKCYMNTFQIDPNTGQLCFRNAVSTFKMYLKCNLRKKIMGKKNKKKTKKPKITRNKPEYSSSSLH